MNNLQLSEFIGNVTTNGQNVAAAAAGANQHQNGNLFCNHFNAIIAAGNQGNNFQANRTYIVTVEETGPPLNRVWGISAVQRVGN